MDPVERSRLGCLARLRMDGRRLEIGHVARRGTKPLDRRWPRCRPMRLMYAITRGDSIGGAQMMVRDLAIGSGERGHEVSLSRASPAPSDRRLATRGIDVRICPGMLREIDPRQDVRAVRPMTDIVREISPMTS